MSFSITDKQLLKKCNQRWKRVEKLLKIEFDSEPFIVMMMLNTQKQK